MKYLLCFIFYLLTNLSFCQPSNCLSAYYPLDGNTNDFSGNALNGTSYNSSPYIDSCGNLSGCYQFIGGTISNIGFMSCPIIADTPFTITAWIKRTTSPNYSFPILSLGFDDGISNHELSFGMLYSNGSINDFHLAVELPGVISVISNSAIIPFDQWVFVACSHDTGFNTNSFVFYVNNSKFINNSIVGTGNPFPLYDNMGIGMKRGMGQREAAEGLIDEVRLYNCQLPDSLVYSNLLPCITDVEQIFTKHELEIYPNPSQGEILIKNLQEEGLLRAFDVSGRLIKEYFVRKGHNQIVTNLMAGTYFLQFQLSNISYNSRVIILK